MSVFCFAICDVNLVPFGPDLIYGLNGFENSFRLSSKKSNLVGSFKKRRCEKGGKSDFGNVRRSKNSGEIRMV